MGRMLFEPTSVGPNTLAHRVVMAPLTRMRSTEGDLPNDLMVEYYTQRASEGGLIIAESATVSLRGRAYLGAPGIYSDQQATAWKKITGAVHARGGKIILQIWHGGRQSHPDNEPNNELCVAPSAIAGEGLAHTLRGWKPVEKPRALELHEIHMIIEEFRIAARYALDAEFDGVELHSANGYLLDEFLQDGSNRRTDEYGGATENRARLLIEVVRAAASVWGFDRVGVRISPSSSFNGMFDSDPAATFGYVARELNKLGLAYLHVIEPRVSGDASIENDSPAVAAANLRPHFKGAIIAAGGFSAETAKEIISSGTADLVAFGRSFIANPDLPERIRAGLPFNSYDRKSFYGGDARGYTDYPFYGGSTMKTA